MRLAHFADMTGAPDGGRWLPLLHEIADRADAIALRAFRSPRLRVTEKPDLSPVTDADVAIEEAARELLSARAPELGVLGEEAGEAAGSADARLVIDPIDGTRNFVRGIPVFGTLLAIEAAGEIVAGVASAPALHARWHASRGGGAFQGERRLHVSGVSSLARALLFHSNLGNAEGRPPAGLPALIDRVDRTRGFGDFWQHLLVAEGAGEIAVDPLMHPWDIAALLVIVEEAGGRATALTGKRSIYGRSLVSTNGVLHEEVLTILVPGTREGH